MACPAGSRARAAGTACGGHQIEAAHAGDTEIGHQQIDAALLEAREAFFPARRQLDGEAAALEHGRQAGPHPGFVVHHQDPALVAHASSSRAAGSSTVKVVPRPTSLSTDRLPPIAVTSPRATASPSPVPRVLVV